MSKKKALHRKLDPNFVSGQPWELDHIVSRYKRLKGWDISRDDVRAARKAVGVSRRKVYRFIEARY